MLLEAHEGGGLPEDHAALGDFFRRPSGQRTWAILFVPTLAGTIQVMNFDTVPELH